MSSQDLVLGTGVQLTFAMQCCQPHAYLSLNRAKVSEAVAAH